MTRPRQKIQERSILEHYLKIRRISGAIREGTEPPDFFVETTSGPIAVEVTTYHQQQANPHGHRPRVVEAAWEKIKRRIAEKRGALPELSQIHARLEFREKLVPSGKETEEFVDTLLRFVISNLQKIGRDRIRNKIQSSDPEILRRYLSTISVREVNCYMEWDWNHDFGGIGTNDAELMAVIGPKLLSYRASSQAVENHLVVAGDGARISEVLSILFLEQFADFHALNHAISSGPFDAIALLGMDNTYLWTREVGWQQVDRAMSVDG